MPHATLRLLAALLFSVLPARGLAAQDQAAPAADAPAPTAAVFVRNRTGPDLAEKRGLFGDLLTAEMTRRGVRVVVPADVLEAVAKLSGVEEASEVGEEDLDELLAQDTSALRLAQNLGVDYVVIGTLGSVTASSREIDRPDLKIQRTVHRARLLASYKILDRAMGAASASTSVTAEQSVSETAAASGFSAAEVADDLLLDAAEQIGVAFEAALPSLPAVAELGDRVTVQIVCTAQDFMVPEVVKDDGGDWILTGNRFQAEPMSVTIEVDGVVVGSAPGTVEVFPGLHKLRLTRELFEPWERTVNFTDGQTLQVALAMTDQGRERFLEISNLYDQLKNSQRESDARAEALNGLGQMFRQSGIRIDSDQVPEFLLLD